MEKDCYKEIIEEVSKKLAEKVCSEEQGLAARATMIIYFDNPVAIGEHPQHLTELDKLNDNLASAEEKLESLRKHFNNTQI